jgi:hypothetical protein
MPRIYLAAVHAHYKHLDPEYLSRAYILEAFPFMQDAKPDCIDALLNRSRGFLLDSGAFTFSMQNKAGKNVQAIDWKGYLDRYIAWINRHNVEHFFELDIERITNIRHVEEMTERLTQETGRQPIPVWHIGRGKDYWYKMVDEYDYIAIAGFVAKSAEIPERQYPIVQRMVNYANSKGVKVHGLGFTYLNWLQRVRFYSVDSTTWQNGMRYGQIQQFDGRTIVKTYGHLMGKRGKYKPLRQNDFREWVKFAEYAEKDFNH